MHFIPEHKRLGVAEPILRRRRVIGFPRILLLSLAAVLISGAEVPAVDLFPPEKPIIMVGEDQTIPAWKSDWDEARLLAQKQQFAAAAERYLAVLNEKPHIEEVKWELFTVLLSLKDYRRAAHYLESLLEINPSKTEYLLSAGNLALAREDYEQALDFFGQVLEQNPLDELAVPALNGMVQALQAKGDTALAIPLMEQLYQRGDPAMELIRELARASAKSGDTAKSLYYYTELVKKFRVPPPVLKETARFFEQAGAIDQAAELWAVLVETGDEDMQLHQKLADFYLDRGQEEKALPHLLTLVDQGIGRQRYLLTLADIHLFHLNRPDKALIYYETYQKEFPGGEDVSANIADIQLILANDLLTIVENDGADMLWQDLSTVTPDRIGIFKAMADILAELGKTDELLAVLRILSSQNTQDLDLLKRLVEVSFANGRFETCLADLHAGAKTVSFDGPLYLLQARCQAALGRDEEELQSYLSYLRLDEGDVSVRTQAIRLAGAIGDVAALERLLPESQLQRYRDEPLLLAYFNALIENGLFGIAQQRIDTVRTATAVNTSFWAALSLAQARSLQAEGRLFAAEQILRQVLAEQPESIDALLQLADYSLQQDDVPTTQIWLRTINQLVAHSDLKNRLTSEQHDTIFNRNMRLQWLLGDRKGVLEKIGTYLQQNIDKGTLTESAMQTAMFFLRYLGHDPQQRKQRLQMFARHPEALPEPFLPAVSVLLEEQPVVHRSKGGTALSNLLDGAHLLQRWGFSRESMKLLDRATRLSPTSVRGKTLQAHALTQLKEYRQAAALYAELSRNYPQEIFFQQKTERLVAMLDPAIASKSGLSALPPSPDTPEQMLSRARDLWNGDEWEQSLSVYDSLQRAVRNEIEEGFRLISSTETFRHLFPASHQREVLISPGKEELLDRVMSPSFFVSHRTEEIARLSARYYETYRWWKVVHKEYEAKLALSTREFYKAERSFQELQDIDVAAAASSYPDLATIYSRIGKRHKESQVYELLRDTKREIPELKEAAAKDVRQRQPHLLLDVHYMEAQGRDDHIDITQSYAGANLQFTPTLLHEAGVWFGRNEYGNSESTTLAKSVYLNSRYAIFFNDYLQGEAQLGFENFDTGGESYLLYDIALRGRLEDKLNVFATINQQPVADTITSLDRGIYKKQFQAGMSLEYLPGFLFGFDFSLHDYNDDNDGKQFNVFASYRFFWEESSFDVKYRYQKVDNTISQADPDSQEALSDSAPPYWSPGKFWQHLLSGEYRIELWPTGKLQSGTSYVSALYGIGFEEGDLLVQKGEINIFLEMTPVFLVKGTFSTDWSEDYERYSALASLAYRW